MPVRATAEAAIELGELLERSEMTDSVTRDEIRLSAGRTGWPDHRNGYIVLSGVVDNVRGAAKSSSLFTVPDGNHLIGEIDHPTTRCPVGLISGHPIGKLNYLGRLAFETVVASASLFRLKCLLIVFAGNYSEQGTTLPQNLFGKQLISSLRKRTHTADCSTT